MDGDKPGTVESASGGAALGANSHGSTEPQLVGSQLNAEPPHEGRPIAPPANSTGKMDPNCKRQGGSRIGGSIRIIKSTTASQNFLPLTSLLPFTPTITLDLQTQATPKPYKHLLQQHRE